MNIIHHIQFRQVLVLLIVLLSACDGTNYTVQVRDFPETKLAPSWSMRLPYDLKNSGQKELGNREGQYWNLFISPYDSIILKVSTSSIGKDTALEEYRNVVKHEMQGKVPRPCLGGYEGYFKDYNFIDSANMLSGLITDFEENGKWAIAFEAQSANTGDQLSIGFEKVSLKDIALIHAVMKSLQYAKKL